MAHRRQSLTVMAEPRMVAKAGLRDQIEAQGRRLDWLAERLGCSKSLISKVIAGQATIAESDARVLAALIHGEVAALFECPTDGEAIPEECGQTEAAG